MDKCVHGHPTSTIEKTGVPSFSDFQEWFLRRLAECNANNFPTTFDGE